MKYVIGVDEAGRGALAGPVSVGAVRMKSDINTWEYFNHTGKVVPSTMPSGGLRDSKKLTERAREKWFSWMQNNEEIIWGVSFSSSHTIDKRGIVAAANAAATRAALKVAGEYLRQCAIVCDAGLHIHDGLRKSIRHDGPRTHDGLTKSIMRQEQIVRGDETVPAIALASIVAKVLRDRHMRRLSHQYPPYQFSKHKGYGTLLHREALEKHGLSPEHRSTFTCL